MFTYGSPAYIDTVITEFYYKPDSFNGFTIRTPFSLNLGKLKFDFVLGYLDYIFEPKEVNDQNYEGSAYFFGTNIVLDNLLKFGGERFDKSYLLEIGSYHSGFGICTGLELDYHFDQIPIFINVYGRVYGLPNEEIFTGWLSLGFGLGIELDNLFSLLKSESGFKK